MIVNKRITFFVMFFIGIVHTSKGHCQSGFDIRSLPRGKEVTLPRPAITMVPANESITVAPTDMPQSLKIINTAASGRLRVSIHDRLAKTIREESIYPGTPFMYAFNGLSQLAIRGVGDGGQTASGLLRIESDKSLSISR